MPPPPPLSLGFCFIMTRLTTTLLWGGFYYYNGCASVPSLGGFLFLNETLFFHLVISTIACFGLLYK